MFNVLWFMGEKISTVLYFLLKSLCVNKDSPRQNRDSQGHTRANQEQIGTARDKAGRDRDYTGTFRQKTATARKKGTKAELLKIIVYDIESSLKNSISV